MGAVALVGCQQWNPEFRESETLAGDSEDADTDDTDADADADHGESDGSTSTTADTTDDTTDDAEDSSDSDVDDGTDAATSEVDTDVESCEFDPRPRLDFTVDPGDGECPVAGGGEAIYLRVAGDGFNLETGMAFGEWCGPGCGECGGSGGVGVPGQPEVAELWETLALFVQDFQSYMCLEIEVAGTPEFDGQTCHYDGLAAIDSLWGLEVLLFGHSDFANPLTPTAGAMTNNVSPISNLDSVTATCPCDVFHDDPNEIGCCLEKDPDVQEMSLVFQGVDYEVGSPQTVMLGDAPWTLIPAQSQILPSCKFASDLPQFSWAFVAQL